MFKNYLKVLKEERPEIVLKARFWEDTQEYYNDYCVLSVPKIEKIHDTDWYKDGGWSECRKAGYGTWESQLEMQFDGTWDSHVLAIKELFPKPNKKDINSLLKEIL